MSVGIVFLVIIIFVQQFIIRRQDGKIEQLRMDVLAANNRARLVGR